MRYMMIVKADAESETGVPPSPEMLVSMGRYNDELIKAGVLLAAEGLLESARGARVRYGKDGPTVTDGPFAESKELIAGFWLIEVRSHDEALAWAKRIPMGEGSEVEVRKVAEAEDFPADPATDALLRKEQAWRDAHQKPVTR